MDLRKTALRLRPSVLAVSALSALAASLLLAAAALAAPAQGISVVRSPASGAHSLAANPDANRLYILSSSGPPKYSPVTSVVAFDASSHSVVGVADALGILPYDVAVDAGRGRVFATNHDGLAVIDASTTKLQRWATLPPNVDLTSSVAVDPSSGRVYVASDLPSPVINVIDPANWKVGQQIKMPGGLTRGLVVNPATNRLYAVTTRTTEAAAISAVDIGTNEVIDLPQVGQTTAAPALDVAHNRLYLGRWHAQVSALDATTYDEVGTSAPLIADASERVAALGVDPDLQHVYAIYGQHLVVLDATTATLAEIARYDLPHPIPPDDVVPSRPLVVNTRTHRVYWTQDGDDSSLGFFQDTDGRAPCVTSEAGCEATPAPAATATPTPPVSDVVGPTEIPTVPPATPMPLPSSDVAFATDTPVPASTPDPNCTPIATDGGDGDSSPTCGMVGGIVPAEDGQQASTPTTTASTPQATQEPAPDCSESAPRPIYRKGGTNPGNFRPRPQDEGRLSFWDSLTAVFEGQPVFQPGDDYVTVDASQLPPGSVEYDEDPPGHVSVIDVPPDELKALAQRCRVPSES